MAIAYVAGAFAFADDNATTSAIDTSGANCIIIFISRNNSSGTVSDSKGNTWTELSTFSAGAGLPFVTAYYAINPTVGSGHTFTVSTATQFPNITAEAYSGVDDYTSQETGTNTSASATSGQPGSITPAADGTLLYSGIAWGASPGTPTVNSGFVIGNGSAGYLIQSTAAAVNPTWSWDNSVEYVINMIAFSAATAGGQISDISAVAVADIAEVNGVSAASIAEVNGLTLA